MSVAVWRLVYDEGGPGARQMAIDRAVLEARILGECPPTLRLYRFVPPCVTLGRFQDVSDVDVEFCERHGIDIARRLTGGRGVFHDDELTYSVVAGVEDGVPRGVAASYRYLCAGLVAAYRMLGVGAGLTARDRGEGTTGACYLHATGADVSVGMAKLSGSAQTWRRDVCLQHGSFVLSRDVDVEAAIFRLDRGARDALGREATTIAGALGTHPSLEEVHQAAVEGMRGALGVDVEVTGLSARELERASEYTAAHRVTPARTGAGA